MRNESIKANDNTDLLNKKLVLLTILILSLVLSACGNVSKNENHIEGKPSSVGNLIIPDEENDLEMNYIKAKDLIENKKYSDAYNILSGIKEYKDSTDLIRDVKSKIKLEKKEAYYQEGLEFIASKDYYRAISNINRIHPYKDSSELLLELKYLFLLGDVNYEKFSDIYKFYGDIKGYKDIDQRINEVKYKYAQELYNNKWFLEAKDFFYDVIDTHNVQPYLDSVYYKIEGSWDDKDSLMKDPVTFKLDRYGKLIEINKIEHIHLWDQESQNTYIDKYTIDSVIVEYKVEILEAHNNTGGNLTLKHESYGTRSMPYIGGEAPKVTTKPEPIEPPLQSLSPTEVYFWIQDRYEYYDNKYNNGEYSGDKYTEKVFSDAAAHFKASVNLVRKAYDAFRY